MVVPDYSGEELRALLPWVSAPIPVPTLAAGPRAAEADSARIRRLVGDRVRGMLLGLAIGDALGNTSEGMTPAERREIHGTSRGELPSDIRDYLPNRREDMRAVGLPSDDTQLASGLWSHCYAAVSPRPGGTGRHVHETQPDLRHRDDGDGFSHGLPTGRQSVVRGGKTQRRERGTNAYRSGCSTPFAEHVVRLWQDVVVATVLTHRERGGRGCGCGLHRSAGGYLTRGVDARDGTAPDIPARWWAETFLKYGRTVETGVAYERGGRGAPFRGSLCSWVEQEVFSAIAAGTGVLEAAERWCSGAYLLETVPCVLHILACHGNDPEEAISRPCCKRYVGQ